MGMKKDSAIHRWEQIKKEKFMDSILEEVLKVEAPTVKKYGYNYLIDELIK